jgi:hypothetical protein|tara:strand:- start:1002 stop:1160 length:159 start_codon:yes stop_codon:yes gene_type:complete
MTDEEAIKLNQVVKELKERIADKSKRILELEKQVDYYKEEEQLNNLRKGNNG